MGPTPPFSESTRGATPDPPTLPNGKSGIVPPQVTEDQNVELKKLEDASSQDKLPLHDDVMQLARLGEIGPVQKLLDEGKSSADYRDHEGITPLHVRQSS